MTVSSVLRNWFRSVGASGLTVVTAEADRIRMAQGEAPAGARPRVHACSHAMLDGGRKALAVAARKLRLRGKRYCALLLAPGDYQIQHVEAPDVPPAELKAAMKWRLKEIIDYPLEQVHYDILDLPAIDGGHARAHFVYAVTAKHEVLRGHVQRFDDAGLGVSVIDVPETAQRNIAALYEQENRGLGMLYLDDHGTLFTITYRGELYLARRFDVSMKNLREAKPEDREDVFNRVLLELQRTLDNFERQFGSIGVSRIMAGPEPEDTGLITFLNAYLGMPVRRVDLTAVIDAGEGVSLDMETQWRLFHPIGATLRSGAQAQ